MLRKPPSASVWAVVLGVLALPWSDAAWGAEPQTDAAADAFFETQVRPLLVARCGKCHGPNVQEPKGGLAFSSRERLLEGGDRGPAVVPGQSEQSLLIEAVRHDQNTDLRMPPGGKLSDAEVATLAQWIADGVVWPTSTGATAAGELPADWAFQAVGNPAPPDVQDRSWPRDDLDRFILARLEAAGLAPAAPLDKPAWLRRVTFDLIGLPPTPEELDAFMGDTSPDALAKVVDRLLASPHYGERWARHWLDVVGYAETDGHEFDTPKPDMYRYRDYLIEAFNEDLPYDAFVREHLAGDLLPLRLSSDGKRLASLVATGWFFLGDVQNVPVDEALAVANIVDRQLDVGGKAFLGLTVGCARCHDHKFDPIPTADYYAQAGMIYSTARVHRSVDSPKQLAAIETQRQALAACQSEIEAIEEQLRGATRRELVGQLKDYLLTATRLLGAGAPPAKRDVESAAQQAGLDARRLAIWCERLPALKQTKDPVFYIWTRLMDQEGRWFARRAAQLGERLAQVHVPGYGHRNGEAIVEDFEQGAAHGWTATGPAFASGPAQAVPADVRGVAGSGYADSRGGVGDVLTGRWLSPPVVLNKPWINFLIAGTNAPQRVCLNTLVFGQALPDLSATGDGTDQLRLVSIRVPNLLGRELQFELVDTETTPGSHVLVDQIFFSDEEPRAPEPNPNARLVELLRAGRLNSLDELAERYQTAFAEALDAWQASWQRYAEAAAEARAPLPPPPQAIEPAAADELRRWICAADSPFAVTSADVPAGSAAITERLAELYSQRDAIVAQFPESTLARVACDVHPRDMRVQISGSPQKLGELVPRGLLTALHHASPHPELSGSGRREWAAWMTAPDNPLTARVMVNRVWLHHFGQGLVRTPDNFGALGERPTHPDLLDYLAREFVREGWSLKRLHRRIALSATYQQGSAMSAQAAQSDPANRLWHHVPQRRLEAECVRDALLAVAGNLDRSLYGRPVPIYFPAYVKYIDYRDSPGESGPLDGEGRRSLYLQVRRNYADILLSAFDFPKPDNCVGLRRTSVLPAMALSMLNNDFVTHQAGVWAGALRAAAPATSARIELAYRQALSRLPDDDERAAAEVFLREQAEAYRQLNAQSDAPGDAWHDLCHVIFNLQEFLYSP
ncbi:MAG: PSD1 and planctomycete cytochrome C domain-containing protein [Pirellulales bacterium]|nr:PSD1 and planctomycete cytochrome C domain-containing protein [Pirellulales bacterium]